MLGQFSGDPGDETRVVVLTERGRESGFARQVVHAGVRTVFMSSLFPTRHGGVVVGEAGEGGLGVSAL